MNLIHDSLSGVLCCENPVSPHNVNEIHRTHFSCVMREMLSPDLKGMKEKKYIPGRIFLHLLIIIFPSFLRAERDAPLHVRTHSLFLAFPPFLPVIRDMRFFSLPRTYS